MITKNSVIADFLRISAKRIEGKDCALNYYHSLSVLDGKPVVLHADTDQISVVLEGKGFAVIDGHSFPICRDSIVMIPAGSKHQFIAEQNELILFHVHIPQETALSDRMVVEGIDFEFHGRGK